MQPSDQEVVERIYNFRSVDSRLATCGQPLETELVSAARQGFEVVINLALHDDPRYSLRDEAGAVRSLGMEYIHIPVQFGAPTEADLTDFFTAMKHQQGKKILLHCAANKRVTAFLGLYRVIEQGWSREEAFALMKTVWEPDAIWQAFIATVLAKYGESHPLKDST